MIALGSRGGGGLRSRIQLNRFFVMLVLVTGCGGKSAHDGSSSPNSGGGESQGGASGIADAGTAGSAGDAGASADAGSAASEPCAPGAAPLRRLTNAQYWSSVSALLGDVGQTNGHLPDHQDRSPSSNFAAGQSVDSELTTAYFDLGKELAARATSDPKVLAELAPCAATATAATVSTCARSTVEAFASNAFRRAPTASEVDELLALHDSIRDGGGTFAQATAGVISAILQAPEFLYRLEWGTNDGSREDARPLSGDERATRLSFLLWGAPPDEALRVSAQSGGLADPAGVLKQAKRLLDDPRAHAGLAAFFDDYLALGRLPTLRSSDADYGPSLAAMLQQATQRFLEVQVFDRKASWPSVLTAETAFVNGPLSALYGLDGISGDTLREVSLDTRQRLGLLTQAAPLIALGAPDSTNPTQRGYQIMQNVLCREVPPEEPNVVYPRPKNGGGTARQRWEAVTGQPECRRCHADMDQLGYALENFDGLGRYRSEESGLPVDAKVDVSGLGPTAGPVELMQRLSALPETQACFARHFAEFSLGRVLASEPADSCLARDLSARFEAAGFNVRQLLLDFTQTDAFLYLPKDN